MVGCVGILDRFKKPTDDKAGRDSKRDPTGEPGCSVCGQTRADIVARIRAKGLRPVGLYFGICPTCRKGFCRDHMVQGDPHDFMDFDKCPDDAAKLDLNWDSAPTPEKPWRTGPVR